MNTKPLTQSEIEELRVLEAKATPGECGGGHVALREEDAVLIAVMRNALPSLLSSVTPEQQGCILGLLGALRTHVVQGEEFEEIAAQVRELFGIEHKPMTSEQEAEQAANEGE